MRDMGWGGGMSPPGMDRKGLGKVLARGSWSVYTDATFPAKHCNLALPLWGLCPDILTVALNCFLPPSLPSILQKSGSMNTTPTLQSVGFIMMCSG